MPNKDKQNWLQRMIMTGAMAENPAVMTASGYRPDKEKGIIQDKVNDEYVKRLRQNLVGIGAAGAGVMTAPYVAEAITNPINIETAKAVGKKVLQGAFDYALADGTVRVVTNKDIMTNVNDGVKHTFGDNKYTNFATKYITPFAPIPVFGTGNFGKNVVNVGRNIYNKANNSIVDIADNYVINRAFKNGKLYFGVPTIFDKAHHQSSSPITKFKFPFKERWDVVNHGADPNAAFFTIGKPAEEGFLSNRPFINEFTIYSKKPLHQVGEIKGVTKNSIRNKIVEKARKDGADAVIFENIADNQLKNQDILMAFDTSDIKHSRTYSKDWSKLTDDQWDLLYNNAISDGNLEEAQRLRDLHFATKTPNNVFVNNESPNYTIIKP
jgi:hypothetical protein